MALRGKPSRPSFRPEVSLEYFPPRTITAERALMTAAYALKRFEPTFQTVTFGAGDSAVDGSLEWPRRLQGLNDIPTASHLTLGQFGTRGSFENHAEALWDAGIKRLVVLRGDSRSRNEGLGAFENVAEAIALLKSHRDFDISVAAYPEVHPLAIDRRADLDVLLAKQDAGADRAITQFFFDNDDFSRFCEQAEKAGLRIPVVAGIMPIVDCNRVFGFAEKCGAAVSADLRARFERCGKDRTAHLKTAEATTCEQVADLATRGVERFHIYTMNRPELTAAALRAISKSTVTHLRAVDERLSA